MIEVLIIMGSSSDMDVAKKAENILKEFKISYKIEVASAHRNPKKVKEIIENTEAEVIIGIAGLAAALPGVVASHTIKPVIGVPVAASLSGLDALLSIVQMPKGIPVACVGIGRADNAALLAIEILSLKNKGIADRLVNYRKAMS
ncbi:MAG: 5-(carboxyamino)imidazole ribonucleotide mutase [bacterium]|nr:5-(carboxyamino)imidazole ribonucleotide mutase [bacterium]